MRKLLRKSLSFVLTGVITASLLIPSGLIASANSNDGTVKIQYVLVNSNGQSVTNKSYAPGGVIKTLPDVKAESGNYYKVTSAPLSFTDNSGEHHFALESALPVQSTEKVKRSGIVYAYVHYVEPAEITLKHDYVDSRHRDVAIPGVNDTITGNINVGDPFPTITAEPEVTSSAGKIYSLTHFCCDQKTVSDENTTLCAEYSDIYNYTITYKYGSATVVKSGSVEYGAKLSDLEFTTDPVEYGGSIPDASSYYEISALNANGVAVDGDSTITDVSGNNTITVTFSNDYNYNVYYFLDGVQYSKIPIPPEKIAFGTTITFSSDPSEVFDDDTGIRFVGAANWDGEAITSDSPQPTITTDSTHNIVIVSFTDLYPFSVKYTENGNDFGKAPYTGGTFKYDAGITADMVPGVLSGLPDGYKLNSITVDNQTITNPTDAAQILFNIAVNYGEENANNIVVDYTKDTFAYTINYIDQATGKAIATDSTGKAVFGATVSKSPITITGYTPVSADAKSVVITSDNTKNIITFYYTANQAAVTTTTNPKTGDNAVTFPILAALFSFMTMAALSLRKIILRFRSNAQKI
jgi:hypothetical protein